MLKARAEEGVALPGERGSQERNFTRAEPRWLENLGHVTQEDPSKSYTGKSRNLSCSTQPQGNRDVQAMPRSLAASCWTSGLCLQESGREGAEEPVCSSRQ